MNFLFVDRIFEFVPFHSAKGIKHVTVSDPYLKTDQDGQGVLPACIVGEALGQLTAWIVMHSCDFKKRPVAGIADEVRIYRDVYVGETVILHTEIERLDDQAVLYNSYATVCGETIFSLKRAIGPLLPMENFIDPERAREQFLMIYRPGELARHVISAPSLILQESLSEEETDSKEEQDFEENEYCFEAEETGFSREHFFFDHILELNPQSISAQKNVSLLAPYFEDHFPRKPVLPLTLLLEGKLELAHLFLQRTLGEEEASRFRPVRLHKIRIKQFIFPGDSIITTLNLKEKLEHGFLFVFKTKVDEKTISSLEAVFEANYM